MARDHFDRLSDNTVEDILNKVWKHRKRMPVCYALVCKRWNAIEKNLRINLVQLHHAPNADLVLKEHGKESVRKLAIDGYHACLHADYTWLSRLAGTLEELSIRAVEELSIRAVEDEDRSFDLELLSRTCSKLKYMHLYRVDAAVRQSDSVYDFKDPDFTFPALKYCYVNRVNVSLAKLLDGSCPVLEELGAFMDGCSGNILSSSTLKVLSLEVKNGARELNLHFPNLETANIEKLELIAPRLKHLSLSYCKSLTLEVSNPLDTLEFHGDCAVVLVDKMHFKSVTLVNNCSVFYRNACAHEVVEKILSLEQFTECEVLRVEGFSACVDCKCEKKLFSSSGVSLARLKVFVLKLYIIIGAEEMNELGDLVNRFVKHCPALPHVYLTKQMDPPNLQTLAKLITNIPVKVI